MPGRTAVQGMRRAREQPATGAVASSGKRDRLSHRMQVWVDRSIARSLPLRSRAEAAVAVAVDVLFPSVSLPSLPPSLVARAITQTPLPSGRLSS